MSFVFSTENELQRVRLVLSKYIRLPLSQDNIPGALMEAVLAHVRNATRLNTYDFIDVYQSERKVGWQVKSTQSKTPVTWKRAKIRNQEQLIDQSRNSQKGVQKLGDAIINFCNEHAQHSIDTYDLDEIGYCRLIIFPSGKVRYFEKILCTRENPIVFEPTDFSWAWSTQKNTVKKEQLSALHGIHKPSGKKWWAWHGLGENQLHFSGESCWWPAQGDPHAVDFSFPAADEKISLDRLLDLLESI
jgi:hypothetical protein